jgi:HPt (histidine-containing phosphotransfer) domain-containing protein
MNNMPETFFNYEEALERLDGDEEFLLELLNELVEQCNTDWPVFQTAIKKQDYKSLRSTAHGLKGAAANLCVDPMADVFFEIEKKGASNSLEDVEDLLNKAHQYKDALETFLKDSQA